MTTIIEYPVFHAQEEHMQDRCNINVCSVDGYDSYGQLVEIWTTISGVPCGIEMTGGVTQYKGQIFSTPVDAILRISSHQYTTISGMDAYTDEPQEFSVSDTITVVEGVAEGDTFSIVGVPRKGRTAQRVALKRIEV